jgi:hypothetical protein
MLFKSVTSVRSLSFANNKRESSQESTMAVLSKFFTNLNLLNILSATATPEDAVAADFQRRLACLTWCYRQFTSPKTSLQQVVPWQN